MFDLIYRNLKARILSGSIDLSNWYRGLYVWIVVVLAIIGLGALALNVSGYQGVNIVLIVPVVLMIAYIGFQPLYLASIAAVAKLTGFKSVAALGTWKQFCVQAALFASLYLLTLGIIPIRENVGGAFLIMGAIVVLGLLVWAFGVGAKWYQKYAVCLAVVAIVVGGITLLSPAQRMNLFGLDPLKAFSTSPKQEIARRLLTEDEERKDAEYAEELKKKRGQALTDAERAELRAIANQDGSLARQGTAAIVGKSVAYTITSLTALQPLCGFQSGQSYHFSITGGSEIYLRHKRKQSMTSSNLEGSTINTHGERLPFAGMDKGWALVLNGTPPNGNTVAKEDGCFDVALNLTQRISEGYEINGGIHIVHIRLHSGPIAAVRSW